jgi:hypothetical protein
MNTATPVMLCSPSEGDTNPALTEIQAVQFLIHGSDPSHEMMMSSLFKDILIGEGQVYK